MSNSTNDAVVAIPSKQRLQSQLAVIQREAKRLRLLIKTATELERLHHEREVPRE